MESRTAPRAEPDPLLTRCVDAFSEVGVAWSPVTNLRGECEYPVVWQQLTRPSVSRIRQRGKDIFVDELRIRLANLLGSHAIG